MNILSFIVLEGPPPPYEDLLALVASKLPQLPRYRQVVRTVPLQIGRPVWVDDANFDLQFHVRQTALARPGDDHVLERLISRLMAQQFDRARPLWELWSVEGLSDGRWVLLSKLHHAMVDGVSGADMVSILLDKEPKPKQRAGCPVGTGAGPLEPRDLRGHRARGGHEPRRAGARRVGRGEGAARRGEHRPRRPGRGPPRRQGRQRVDAERPDRPEPPLHVDLLLARRRQARAQGARRDAQRHRRRDRDARLPRPPARPRRGRRGPDRARDHPDRPARARREGHRRGVRPVREPDHRGLRRPAGRRARPGGARADHPRAAVRPEGLPRGRRRRHDHQAVRLRARDVPRARPARRGEGAAGHDQLRRLQRPGAAGPDVRARAQGAGGLPIAADLPRRRAHGRGGLLLQRQPALRADRRLLHRARPARAPRRHPRRPRRAARSDGAPVA